MKNKAKSLIKDTLLFALGSIGSKLILFIMMPIYTSYMTEAEYGISELVFSMGQLLIPFLSLVIFDAVVRFGLSKESKPEDVLLIGLAVAAAGSVLTVGLTPLFSLYNAIAPWRWYMCAYIICYIFNAVLGCYVKSVDKNKLYATVNILQTLTMALLNVALLVVKGMGVQGYLLSTIIASALASAVFFLFGNMSTALRKARFNKQLLHKMLAFSAPLVLNNVSWWVIHSSDKVMIELMLGATALGIYTVAAKIPALINVLISIFSQAWNISTAKEVEGDSDCMFYSRVFHFYQCICFCAVIILNAVIKPFMSIYVDDAFYDAWRYVPLLLVAAGFSCISAYFVSLYAALKKSVNNMVTTLSAAVLNIILNFFFIRLWGLWGAAIATLISYIVLASIRMYDVKRYITVRVGAVRYVINSCLILLQAVIISLDYNAFLCSGLVLFAFGLVNAPALVREIHTDSAL